MAKAKVIDTIPNLCEQLVLIVSINYINVVSKNGTINRMPIAMIDGTGNFYRILRIRRILHLTEDFAQFFHLLLIFLLSKIEVKLDILTKQRKTFPIRHLMQPHGEILAIAQELRDLPLFCFLFDIRATCRLDVVDVHQAITPHFASAREPARYADGEGAISFHVIGPISSFGFLYRMRRGQHGEPRSLRQLLHMCFS